MKRIRILFLVWIVAMTGIFVMNSCEDVPLCEREHVGMVTVENKTGYDAMTDITWGDVIENDEVWLNPEDSYTYYDIPAGTIEIWLSYDGVEWVYNYESLGVCEHLTYRWYLNSLKSANGCPFVLYLPDGTTVVPERKDKH